MPVYQKHSRRAYLRDRSIERDPVMDGVLLAPAPFSI